MGETGQEILNKTINSSAGHSLSSHSEEPDKSDFNTGFCSGKAFSLVSKKIVKKNISPILESRN
jgi:hypothetical protein